MLRWPVTILFLATAAHAEAPPPSLHFDAGQLDVRKSDLPLVAAHCRYAAEHPTDTLQLGGHTDLRGGQEYSLAIGQLRADRVRKRLEACGVAPGRIEAVSYGKERPLQAGASPAAGSVNRRVEIAYRPAAPQPLTPPCPPPPGSVPVDPPVAGCP